MTKRLVVLVLVFALSAAGLSAVSPRAAAQDAIECYGSEGSEVSVLSVWAGEEENTFKAVLAPVLEACEITLNHEGTRDLNTVLDSRVQGNQPPDIASMPNPGALTVYADKLVSLDELNVHAENYVQGWKDLGSVDGVWVGLPIKTDIKSLVWYSPLAFEAAGYTVPTTWDEMIALMDQMVADGDVPPLSMGFESGGATGWTATDFVQDILIRTAGVEATNGLVDGTTAWDDPAVVAGWELYASWVENYGGGADAAITTSFGDAILLPFQDPPAAWMVKQSGFAGSAFVAPNFPDYIYGEDFAFFVLPSADGAAVPMQVGGDFIGAFNNTPAVQAILGYLSSAAGAAAWAASGFDLTPNSAVTPDAYGDNPISADKAAALGAAPDVTFDVGDLLPAGLGQAEFDGITAVVGGSTTAADALADIQARMTEALGM
ncbi:MAG: carbohydrate ABC transporter substrate-binding protein [Chloroflexi bacterium]|nr:carbohydrate ABC transporter substrate-binding protein [Chloroflexota bacterium]